MRTKKLFLLAILSMLILPFNLWAQSTECDITLSPEDDVALIVEEALNNQTICFESGEFRTNFTIGESITLRGAESGETVLVGATAGRSVVRMFRTGDTLDVTLENLIVRGAFPIEGQEDCFSQGNCPDGISITGDFNVSLLNVQVLDNHDDGIQIFGGRLITDGVVVQENGDSGLITQGFSQFGPSEIRITRSQFSQNNSDGLLLLGPTQFLMEDSQANGNQENGLNIIGNPGPNVTLRRSDVMNNGFDGIQFIDIGNDALLESLRIEANGVRPECAEDGISCNGLTLNGNGNITLRNSQIIQHSGWGIMAVLIQCGAEEDDYHINLTLEETVFENNTLGESCLP